jgi:hypothetical protein
VCAGNAPFANVPAPAGTSVHFNSFQQPGFVHVFDVQSSPSTFIPVAVAPYGTAVNPSLSPFSNALPQHNPHQLVLSAPNVSSLGSFVSYPPPTIQLLNQPVQAASKSVPLPQPGFLQPAIGLAGHVGPVNTVAKMVDAKAKVDIVPHKLQCLFFIYLIFIFPCF